MNLQNDTIAAIVTAAGEASVGIVRLSGEQAIEIAQKIYRGKDDLLQAESHTIHYGKVFWEDHAIDEVLVMLMRSPHSFTGEDVVEIQGHGGPIVMERILQAAIQAGARLAQRGEYSKRAFLNGKMDLAQAEAIMDLVSAKTDSAADMALQQRFGRLSGALREIRSQILELIAYIQADLDYPEDDIERFSQEEYLQKASDCKARLENMMQSYQQGRILRDGLKVVLAGKPNVGKSSLLNALLQKDRAIVSQIPGTTRDTIEAWVRLRDIPICLVDTAGIRQTEDAIEKIGVQRSMENLRQADLVLYLYEPMDGLNEEDRQTLQALPSEIPLIFLRNKSDLGASQDTEMTKQLLQKGDMLEISALEGSGLDALAEKIKDMFFAGEIHMQQQTRLSNQRHVQAVSKASVHLQSFIDALSMGVSEDLLVIDLQNAWEWLGEITGENASEDLLDVIFSKFCLGK